MNRKISAAGRGPHRDAAKAKFWRQALRQFAASGQSVRAFCTQRGLSEPSFYAWRRTLAQREAAIQAAKTGAPAASPAPAFVPIRLTATTSAGTTAPDTAPIEIVLPGGTRIHVQPPVDRQTLIQVVTALRSADAVEA